MNHSEADGELMDMLFRRLCEPESGGGGDASKGNAIENAIDSMDSDMEPSRNTIDLTMDSDSDPEPPKSSKNKEKKHIIPAHEQQAQGSRSPVLITARDVYSMSPSVQHPHGQGPNASITLYNTLNLRSTPQDHSTKRQLSPASQNLRRIAKKQRKKARIAAEKAARQGGGAYIKDAIISPGYQISIHSIKMGIEALTPNFEFEPHNQAIPTAPLRGSYRPSLTQANLSTLPGFHIPPPNEGHFPSTLNRKPRKPRRPNPSTPNANHPPQHALSQPPPRANTSHLLQPTAA